MHVEHPPTWPVAVGPLVGLLGGAPDRRRWTNRIIPPQLEPDPRLLVAHPRGDHRGSGPGRFGQHCRRRDFWRDWRRADRNRKRRAWRGRGEPWQRDWYDLRRAVRDRDQRRAVLRAARPERGTRPRDSRRPDSTDWLIRRAREPMDALPRSALVIRP